jgi:hypothetical protein
MVFRTAALLDDHSLRVHTPGAKLLPPRTMAVEHVTPYCPFDYVPLTRPKTPVLTFVDVVCDVCGETITAQFYRQQSTGDDAQEKHA